MESSKKSLPPEAYQELTPGQTYIPFIPPESPSLRSRSGPCSGGSSCPCSSPFPSPTWDSRSVRSRRRPSPSPSWPSGSATSIPRKSSILENVILQSIGAASGAVVAGAIFTIPALYILGIPTSILKDLPVHVPRRLPGHSVLDPAPALFLRRPARQAPLPRGHGHDRNPGHGRSGGRPSQGPHPGHRRQRTLRIFGHRRPGLE